MGYECLLQTSASTSQHARMSRVTGLPSPKSSHSVLDRNRQGTDKEPGAEQRQLGGIVLKVDLLKVMIGVDHAQWQSGTDLKVTPCCVRLNVFTMDKQHTVLGVVVDHSIVLPDGGPDSIDQEIGFRFKQLFPILEPLPIWCTATTLKGNARGEQNKPALPGQGTPRGPRRPCWAGTGRPRGTGPSRSVPAN